MKRTKTFFCIRQADQSVSAAAMKNPDLLAAVCLWRRGEQSAPRTRIQSGRAQSLMR